MGTPLPKNEPGAACSNCWGTNKPFGDGNTPKFVSITFSDIVVTQAWLAGGGVNPNQKFLLTQMAAPCSWQFFCPPVACTLIYNFYNTEILLQIDGDIIFSKLSIDLCLLEADNDYFYPDRLQSLGGSCVINWNVEGL